MAVVTKNNPLEAGQTQDSPGHVLGAAANASQFGNGFGAYGAPASDQKSLNKALDKEPESKTNGSLAFTDSDRRWLKELGITTTDPQSHHEAWRTEGQKYNHEHRKWANTMGGRLGMRSVSRGIVGAAFFAAGNMYAGKAMKGYVYNREAEGIEKELQRPEGWLQHIARAIDRTAGEGVYQAVKAATKGNEEKALKSVMFRDTRDFGNKTLGRSLGSEVVGVTFDFASMSFGDYMTRYFIGLVDPNAKAHWMKDGHIDVPGGLKDLFKNVFRGLTYAAGEDMAVAIPYVYGMRMQRNMIEKYSPGFKYDSDYGRNGGSFKVNDEGKVIGDYQTEGMLDLMGRFSWYNVGTKMFRDAYSHVSGKLEEWWDGDRKIHAPHIDPKQLTPQNIGLAAAHAVRYAVRTTAKVMGYMIPATAFFFVTRTPQSKVRGFAIHPTKGILGRTQISGVAIPAMNDDDTFFTKQNAGKEIFEPIKPGSNYNSTRPDGRKSDVVFEKLYYRDSNGKRWDEGKITAANYPFDANPETSTRRQAFGDSYYNSAEGRNPPWYQKPVNRIAEANYKAGTKVFEGIRKAGSNFEFLGLNLDRDKTEKFARLYTNAAISYTPYFMMKTDVLSSEWDTARTDMGIDRALDGLGTSLLGAVTFNGKKIKHGFNEFSAGLSESRRAFIHEPFLDPKREEIAQRARWATDPEHASNEAFQLTSIGQHVHKKDMIEKKSFAHDGLKQKSITPATFTQLKTPESWATQEAMRKFQETDSQGQSVH